MMKILSISDIVIDFFYSPSVAKRFKDVDLIISCGDLPYYYVEYILTMVNKPLFFVRGNHANLVEYTTAGPRTRPEGAVDLHRTTAEHDGLLLAGVEGCLQYNAGPFQYTQGEMWGHVLNLVPLLMVNRLNHGRYLDVFVTHASPWGIHDEADLPHQGIKAFNWLLKVFKPAYHFHGHIHVYRSGTATETVYEQTSVINTYGYRETVLEVARPRLPAIRE